MTKAKVKLQLAGCVIQNDKGEILLLHRNTPNRTQWELPGGKIDPGEDPRKTAQREVGEELGVRVKIIRKAGEHEFLEDGNMMDYIWYNAAIISGEPSPIEDKHDKVEYFSWDELSLMLNELSSNTRNLVDAYFAKHLTLP